MTDKEKLREWAQTISQEGGKMGRIEVDFDSVMAAANYIKETIPAPTMDEVGWDDEKHRFAVAKRGIPYGEDAYDVLMLGKRMNSDRIRCLDLESLQTVDVFDDELTPTGKKYVLQGENDG